MNTYFYEIETRQRLQTRLNEANNARLLRQIPVNRFNFSKAIQTGWASLQGFVRQLFHVTVHSTQTPKMV